METQILCNFANKICNNSQIFPSNASFYFINCTVARKTPCVLNVCKKYNIFSLTEPGASTKPVSF